MRGLWAALRRSRKPATLRELSEARAAGAPEPALDDLERLIFSLRSTAPEIRTEAIKALGTHWAEPRAFDAIMTIMGDKGVDEDEQLAACDAVGEYARAFDEKAKRAMRALAAVASDEGRSAAIRASAYSSLSFAAGRISPRELASAPERIEDLNVDWEWVRQFLDGA